MTAERALRKVKAYMAEPTIKAIETVYPWPNGPRYRSRLEARWAVFFDWFHLRYEYEKEGYDLYGSWYLPDFWLPDMGLFVEVKGTEPNEMEQVKAAHLALATEQTVAIFYGDMNLNKTRYHYQFVPWKKHFERANRLGQESTISAYDWHLWALGEMSKAQNRRGWVMGTHRDWVELDMGMEWVADGSQVCLDVRLTCDPPHADIVAAYAAARQARFEHGESGAPK